MNHLTEYSIFVAYVTRYIKYLARANPHILNTYCIHYIHIPIIMATEYFNQRYTICQHFPFILFDQPMRL